MLCLGLTACGDTSDSKAPAETTTTTAEITTTKVTTTEIITTTTELATTTVETTTTVTETTTAEPETTTSEESETTSLITMADNPDGLYPMSECFRRIIEDKLDSKVVKIWRDESLNNIPFAKTEDGTVCFLVVTQDLYNSGESIYIDKIDIVYFGKISDEIADSYGLEHGTYKLDVNY